MSKKDKQQSDDQVETEADAATAAQEEQQASTGDAAEGSEAEAETVDALKDRLQRLAAEYQNFRKQADRRNTDTRRFVKRDLVQQMLPFVDNFGHAMQALDQGQDAQNVLMGVKMIHEMLGKFLEENGIAAIRAKGEIFDPNLHEAVSREETEDAAEHTVLTEIQKGYRMGDLVVRHARVVVAAKKSAEPSLDEDDHEEKGE